MYVPFSHLKLMVAVARVNFPSHKSHFKYKIPCGKELNKNFVVCCFFFNVKKIIFTSVCPCIVWGRLVNVSVSYYPVLYSRDGLKPMLSLDVVCWHPVSDTILTSTDPSMTVCAYWMPPPIKNEKWRSLFSVLAQYRPGSRLEYVDLLLIWHWFFCFYFSLFEAEIDVYLSCLLCCIYVYACHYIK